MSKGDELVVHRKSLLVTSMITLFYYYSKASISRVGAAGVYIDFENESAFVHFLWVFWAYFLLRYSQFFFTFGYRDYRVALGQVTAEVVAPRLLGIDSYSYSIISDEDFIKQCHFRLSVGPEENSLSNVAIAVRRRVSKPTPLRSKQKLLSKRRAGCPKINLGHRRPFIPLRTLLMPFFFLTELAPRLFAARVFQYPPGAVDQVKGRVRDVHPLEFFTGIRLLSKTLFLVSLKHTAFFDYFVPFLVALLPLVYALTVQV